MYKLLFLGFGNVGKALAALLVEKKELLSAQYDFHYMTVGIVDMLKGSVIDDSGIDLSTALDMVANNRSLNEYPAASGETGLDAAAAIRKTGAGVLLEMTYTDIKNGEPATSYIRAALNRGMHVATTNKGPVALFNRELQALADEKGVRFLYEGTVMSGTPMLNLVRETMAGSEIMSVQGILNGTTNYILTQMEEGMAYGDALRQAQELGYAEAVPDADVKGWDALAKATILANVLFGAPLKPDDIPCRGITQLTPGDIAEAKSENRRYKLLANVSKEGGRVAAAVAPQKIDLTHPLASVSGATNALTVTTDTLGDVTIVGPGAGRRETGYSLLIDLLTIGGKK